MTNSLSTSPRVEVYRAEDHHCYIIMHMALVDPGHYVGWGELSVMSYDVFLTNGLDAIIESIRSFPFRDGKDRSKRLKLKEREPFHLHFDLVTIRAISETTLELFPYSRSKTQHERLDQKKILVEMPITPKEFLATLERAFL